MTDYIFSVARIRELENELLTDSETARLIESKNIGEAVLSLYADTKERSDISDPYDLIKKEKLRAWETVSSLSCDSIEIKSLTIQNDFHNLKAALKSISTGTAPERLYIFPTVTDTHTLFENIRDRRFYELPEYMQASAEVGYSVLAETKNGQYLETFLDKETLTLLRETAKKSKSEMYKRYIDFFIAMSDIKTAYRGMKADKGEKFFHSAICGSDEIERETLSEAASKGEQSLFELIEASAYRKAAEQLRKSPSLFERCADDELTRITESAKAESFSVDPCFAYYCAKLTEIKNIGIILACKRCGTSNDIITERLRKAYV